MPRNKSIQPPALRATMEKEAPLLENLALAIAARNSHGYVICQVERIAAEGSLDSRFTNRGFLRMKLGKELQRREVSARVFETRREAERNLTTGPVT